MNFARNTTSSRLFLAVLFSFLAVAGSESIAVGDLLNAPKTVASFTTKQLEKKWKHAVDFGITTTKRNPKTLVEFQAAITKHLDDAGTVVKGTYGWLADSVVHFNPKTNLVVVLDKAGNFVTGWRLTPGTAQFEKFIKDGFLK